jgi:hypothetical protein
VGGSDSVSEKKIWTFPGLARKGFFGTGFFGVLMGFLFGGGFTASFSSVSDEPELSRTAAGIFSSSFCSSSVFSPSPASSSSSDSSRRRRSFWAGCCFVGVS